MQRNTISGRRIAVLALLLGTVLVSSAVVSAQDTAGDAQVIGSPDVDLSVSDNRIETGTSVDIPVQVLNSGDITRAGPSDLEQRVTTARNVRFEVDESGLPDGMELSSGPVSVSSVPDGGIDPISFTLDVSDEVDAGSYRVPVTISYDYTRLAERTAGGQTRYRDFSTEETEYVTLVVEDDARFSVEAVGSKVIAGDAGDYALRVRNTGVETANNPRVTLSADQTGVFFGGLETGQSTKTVGVADSLAPGESARVTTKAAADADISPASYPVDATVRYESTGGVTHDSPVSTASVYVGDEQSFSLNNVTSSLRVGEEGDIMGTVENTGPQNVNSVVVRYAGESQTVTPIEDSVAVGPLDVGETASFSLPVSVSSESEPGEKSVEFSVRYRNSESELRTYDELDVRADVSPERDRFKIDVVDRELAAGGSRSIEIDVTSNLNQTASDVEARLFADDPLDTGDTDTGYVRSLEPGETATMTFELTSTGSATPGSTYPISVDVRYDDADGDSQLTDTYRTPIDVTESQDGGLPLPLVVVALMLTGTGGLVWYRRQK